MYWGGKRGWKRVHNGMRILRVRTGVGRGVALSWVEGLY